MASATAGRHGRFVPYFQLRYLGMSRGTGEFVPHCFCLAPGLAPSLTLGFLRPLTAASLFCAAVVPHSTAAPTHVLKF